MNKVTLPNTDIVTTTLGFGCGGLMRVTSRRGRQHLLEEAFEAGIRHFDVARMYGLGKVESEVGSFARGRREHIVLSSKFGIEVKRTPAIVTMIHAIGRKVMDVAPSLRRAVRGHTGALYMPKKFDVATAQRSLEESLRALHTDYLDIYLLHEPELADVRHTAVWEYLERAKEMGLIRAWGVAGYPWQIKPVCETIPALAQIIQIPNDAVHRQLDKFLDFTSAAFITFSPYSEAFDMLLAMIAADNGFVEHFKNATGLDLRQRGVLAKMLLGYCLHANPAGVTLFSSGRSEGVQENAAIWRDGFPDAAVRAFEELVAQSINQAHITC